MRGVMHINLKKMMVHKDVSCISAYEGGDVR
jgi:hypothetical protein